MNLIDKDKVIELLNKKAGMNQKFKNNYPKEEPTHQLYSHAEFVLLGAASAIGLMPTENPPEKEDKVKLTKDQIIANRKHNQQYLNLDDTEILLHEKLMEVDINSYPKELHDFLDKEHAGDLFNGDAFSCWVADWIKSLRDKLKQNPPDKRCGTCNFWNTTRTDECAKRWRRFNENSNQRLVMRATDDGVNCPDWQEKVKENPQIPQCQSCANWQDKIHHVVSTGEPVYKCKKMKFVFPTDVRTWISNCWEKPKEKRRVWTCLNCGKDITYPISTDVVVNENTYFHWSKEFPHLLRRRCDDNYNEPLTATNLAIPKPDSEKWVEE